MVSKSKILIYNVLYITRVIKNRIVFWSNNLKICQIYDNKGIKQSKFVTKTQYLWKQKKDDCNIKYSNKRDFSAWQSLGD